MRARQLKLAIGFAVAALFTWLIVRAVDWATVERAWRAASPAHVALAVALLLAGLGVRVARWWWMLRSIDRTIPFAACVRPFVVSIALNNTLPFRAGDVARAFGFRDAIGTGATRIVGTLVIERALDAFVLLALFFVGLRGVAADALPASFVRAGTVLGVAALAAILVLLVLPRPMGRLADRILRAGPFRDRAIGRRLGDVAHHLFDTLALVQSPARALQLLALSVLAWTLEGTVFVAVAAALATPVAAMGPWFSLATGTLATLLPSSPGYVGTFDWFAMLGLAAYGAPRAAATAHALLVHLVIWLPPTVLGGLLALAPALAVRTRAAGDPA
jgi:uncharacterized protein (TIRG00374 family)